jgi:hypothetical protein
MVLPKDFDVEPFLDLSRWNVRQRDVYATWRSLSRNGRRLPARSTFDPLAIPSALGWLWLHDVQREPLRFHCRLFGTEVAKATGIDITGRWLDDTPLADPSRPLDLERLRRTAIDGFPTWARTRSTFQAGDAWPTVESLIVPFASDGETPDIVMGVSTYYRTNGAVLA